MIGRRPISQRFGAAVVATVVVVALTASTGRGQPAQEEPATPQTFAGSGTELFRGLLDYHGLTPLKSVADLDRQQGSWNKVVVIVLRPVGGGRGLTTVDVLDPRIAKVVAAGGAMLVATRAQDANLGTCLPGRPRVEVESTGELVTQPRKDGGNAAAGRPGAVSVLPLTPLDMNRIESLTQIESWDLSKASPEWMLFAGRYRVATANPGVLRINAPNPYAGNALARYQVGALARLPSGRPRPLGRTDLFAAGGSGPADRPFRTLFLADPDVFSNRLIAAADEEGNQATDNFALAVAVVRWLRGPDATPKTMCLFVDAGRVVDHFDDVKYADAPLPPIPPIPLPPLTDPAVQRKLAEAIDNFVATNEDADAHNRAIAGTDRSYRNTARWLAAAAAVAALVAIAVRVRQSRHAPDLPPVPTDTGRVGGSAPPGSLARRREEAVQAGDYGEYVREYLRELFAARGFPVPASPPPALPPRVHATGPDAGAVRDRVRILWGVAYGRGPQPVPYSRWKELEPMIDAVRRAAAEGRWHFGPLSHDGGAA